MALHMRRIVTIIIAFTFLVGASPLYAVAEEITLGSEVSPAQAEAAEAASGQAGEEPVAESPEQSPSEANNEKTVIISIYDENGEYVLKECEQNLISGMSLAEVFESICEEEFGNSNSSAFAWKEIELDSCLYEINGERVKVSDAEKYRISADDEIEIWLTEEALTGNISSENMDITEDEVELQRATNDEIKTAHDASQKKVIDKGNQLKWAYGSEWTVISLSGSDKFTDKERSAYCEEIAAYLKHKKSAQLDKNQSSDNSKLIIALTSIGYDPSDVVGYNLLEPLSDMDFVKKQGINGPVWALIAFDSHNYEIPQAAPGKTQTTREGIVDLLLESQIDNKGWAYGMTSSDVDMTCMVIQALTPYYDRDSRVKEAVDNGLLWLSEIQKEDGIFATQKPYSSESQSQVIIALTGLGIDPQTDARFIKNGKNAVDALLSFNVRGGGFKHVSSNTAADSLATQQGYQAIEAYYRLLGGGAGCYNMNTVTLNPFTAAGNKKPTIDDEGTGGKASGATRSLGFLALGADGTLTMDLNSDGAEARSTTLDNAEAEDVLYEYVFESEVIRDAMPWIFLGIGALAGLLMIILLKRRNGC